MKKVKDSDSCSQMMPSWKLLIDWKKSSCKRTSPADFDTSTTSVWKNNLNMGKYGGNNKDHNHENIDDYLLCIFP